MERKILAMIASLAMVGVMFTGCGCRKEKKSQEVNKTEVKTETPVESTTTPAKEDSSTGFEAASGEKSKKEDKKTDEDFGIDSEENKSEKNKSEKNLKSKPRSNSAPKQVKSNKGKPAVIPQKNIVKQGDNKLVSKKEIEDMAALIKGLQQGEIEAKKQKEANQAAAPSKEEQKLAESKKEVNQQENAKQGASVPAGEKKQEPEKKPEANKGVASVGDQKLVESKKN